MLTLRTGGLKPFSLRGKTSWFSFPRDYPAQGHCAPGFGRRMNSGLMLIGSEALTGAIV
jgi:hypothetical protein